MYPRQKYNRANFEEQARKLRDVENYARTISMSTDTKSAIIGEDILRLLKR